MVEQEITPTDLAIAGLALAVAGHAITWFFKSPKETSRETLAEIGEVERTLHDRVNKVEDDHAKLERQYIRSSVELGVKVQNLAEAIKELSVNVKTLTSRMDNHHVGGKHPF